MKDLGIKKELRCTYDEALARAPEALKAEGFGVLTEVDIQATLKAKLGVDFRRYKILGACNPPLAHRALTEDLAVGLMMPCNVVVYEADGGRAVVMAVDPTLTVAASGNPELGKLAADIKDRLTRAIAKLE
jgi:uncharacterized protein (DUF302 family)